MDMHEFYVNLVIGIVGGIYSGIIVSRIFLIREEYQEQLEILQKNFYYLGSIRAFLDVIEIILKNMSDTSLKLQESPNYAKTHKLIDGDRIITELKRKLLNESIDKICANESNFTLREKELIQLQHKTYDIIIKFKDVEIDKFEVLDDCKQKIDTLKDDYEHCFNKKTKTFLGLVIRDRILIILFVIFIIMCLGIFVI